jgi:hypothetical protein
MERWLRGNTRTDMPEEPPTETFPPEQLLQSFDRIAVDPAQDRGFNALTEIYRGRPPKPLKDLLGLDAVLPQSKEILRGPSTTQGDWLVERYAFPSEGQIWIPTLLVRRSGAKPAGVTLWCDDRAKEERLASGVAEEALRRGRLVVMPDVRFVGALGLDHIRGRCLPHVAFPIACPYSESAQGDYTTAWVRNGILWGRPLPAMTATDILDVIDGVADVLRGRLSRVSLNARGVVAAGAVFAALLDERIEVSEIDSEGKTFAAGTLPIVPGILHHGDIDDLTRSLSVRRERP